MRERVQYRDHFFFTDAWGHYSSWTVRVAGGGQGALLQWHETPSAGEYTWVLGSQGEPLRATDLRVRHFTDW